MPKSSAGKKGGKKIGRGLRRPTHARYVNESRYETNKIKRLRRHIKWFEKDTVALKALKRLRG